MVTPLRSENRKVAPLKLALTKAAPEEGTLRGSAWVEGDYADPMVLGPLAPEWVVPVRSAG
ncbi:MAG: hypothetical protein QOF53_885 [Nocardioidaceae bacterium]|jgi:hypothetical protein|nr:hypothetical protein [Nocardioidaceae bacterium]